jgi:hypothetical protein
MVSRARRGFGRSSVERWKSCAASQKSRGWLRRRFQPRRRRSGALRRSAIGPNDAELSASEDKINLIAEGVDLAIRSGELANFSWPQGVSANRPS